MGVFGVTRKERDEALQQELEAIREQNRVLQEQLAAILGRMNGAQPVTTSYTVPWPARVAGVWDLAGAGSEPCNASVPDPQPDPRPVIACLYNGGPDDPDGETLPRHVTWRGLNGWPSYCARVVRGDYDLSVSVPYRHPALDDSGRMDAFWAAQLLEAWIELHPAMRARVLDQIAPDLNILLEEGIEIVPGSLLEECGAIPLAIKDWAAKAPFVAVKPEGE